MIATMHITPRNYFSGARVRGPKPAFWLLFFFSLLFLPLSLQAEVASSSSFKMQVDGIAPAIDMRSSSFKLFSIAGDGRAVKLSSSSNYKIGSSVVYAIGARMEDTLCFAVRTQNAKVALICL